MKTKKMLLGLFCSAFLALTPSSVSAFEGPGDRGGNVSGGMAIAHCFYNVQNVSVSVLDESNIDVSFSRNFGLVDVIVLGTDGSEVYVETVDTSVFSQCVISLDSTDVASVVVKDGTGAIIY